MANIVVNVVVNIVVACVVKPRVRVLQTPLDDTNLMYDTDTHSLALRGRIACHASTCVASAQPGRCQQKTDADMWDARIANHHNQRHRGPKQNHSHAERAKKNIANRTQTQTDHGSGGKRGVDERGKVQTRVEVSSQGMRDGMTRGSSLDS